MDSNNKIINKWVLVYRDKPYFLIDRFYVDSEGVDVATSNIIETFDSEDALNNRVLELESGILIVPDYSITVVNFIREKYSIDDEFALNAKSMQMYYNNCNEEQRAKWMIEIKEFTDYRQQCIIRAREVCGIV